MLRFYLLFVPLVWCLEVFATSGITYQGRLFNPDATPVLANSVQFRLEIRTPGTATHTLNIPMASATGVTAGLLSKTDFDAFTAKLDGVAGSSLSSGHFWVGNGSNQAAAVSMSGGATLSNAGALTVTGIRGNSVAAGTPTEGQVLRWNNLNSRYESSHFTVSDVRSAANLGISVFPTSCLASQTMTWSSLSDTFVCSDFANTASGNIAATTVQGAINELDSEKVAKSGDTMTGNLQINSQNEIRLADADSSNYVAFRAPSSVSTNRVWTLQNNHGSNGQVLTTNGSGTLSWSSVSSGSGDVNIGGNSVSSTMTIGTNSNHTLALETNGSAQVNILTNGNVGVGTSSPIERLEINGGVKIGNTSNTNAGTIRWDGQNFEGYDGSNWVRFIAATDPAACDQASEFTTPGTYSYTVPVNFGTLTIRLWGAGGGGSAPHLSNGPGGSGGQVQSQC